MKFTVRIITWFVLINVMHNEIVKQFGREVVVASGRSNRPKLINKPISVCPFCQGNEHMTPPETDRVGKNGKWLLRSFENKYPILSPKFDKAFGWHEVIVETPDHSQLLQETDVKQYLEFCFKRMDAAKNDRIEYVLLFKNHGLNAGASIPHEHSQLIALTETPPMVLEELEAFKKNNPLDKPEHVVLENSKAVCIASPAPRYPYELWIAPKERVSTRLDPEQVNDFAEILKTALTKLNTLLEDPDYCFFFHYFPQEDSHFHLHLEITPRISRWAGFELGSGITVSTISPEVAVSELSKV